jgi:hypothetical protein
MRAVSAFPDVGGVESEWAKVAGSGTIRERFVRCVSILATIVSTGGAHPAISD